MLKKYISAAVVLMLLMQIAAVTFALPSDADKCFVTTRETVSCDGVCTVETDCSESAAMNAFYETREGSIAYVDSFKSELVGLELRAYETLEKNINFMKRNEEERLYVDISDMGEIHKDNSEELLTVTAPIMTAMFAFDYDNPQYFWLRLYHYGYTASNGIVTGIYFKGGEENMWHNTAFPTYEDVVEGEKIFNAKVDEIVNETADMSVFLTLWHFNHYLVGNCEYNPHVKNEGATQEMLGYMPWCAYSGIVHQEDTHNYPVCSGYAKAFKSLCNKAGIRCLMFKGCVNSDHYWSAVQMPDENWYYVDVTFNDRGWGETTYFLRGKSMETSHTVLPVMPEKWNRVLEYPQIAEEDYSGCDDILFADDKIITSNKSCKVQGTDITIKASGTYNIAGTLTDGSITVKTGENDTENVELVLDDVNVTCSYDFPLEITASGDVIITLKGDNSFALTNTDSEDISEKDAIHARCNLSVDGTGALNINSDGKYGIYTLGDFSVNGGTVHITANAGEGIYCRSCFTADGESTSVSVNAYGYGIYSSNDMNIKNGSFDVSTITASGLNCRGDLTISGGEVYVSTANSDEAITMYCAEKFAVTGGTVAACGPVKSPLHLSWSSIPDKAEICTVAVTFNSVQSADASLILADESGNQIIMCIPHNDYNNAVFCSEKLEKGSRYKLYTGGILAGSFKTSLSSNITEVSIAEFAPAPSSGLGDLNGDGKVNTSDAVVVLKHSAGITELTEEQQISGDLNGDGKVNTADAVAILKFAAGMIELACVP